MRVAICVFLVCLTHWLQAQEVTLFIGTYTGTGSKGIYSYAFNTQTGEGRYLNATDSNTINNPSFLALSPDHQYLYAVNETGGKQEGFVSAFKLSGGGALNFLNRMPSAGDHPCYVAVHPSGNWALVGNYSGGNFAALPINTDGSLQPFRQSVQHEGKGPNTARQEKPHVHATVFDPSGRYVFVPDLGTDKINIYAFNGSSTLPLQPAQPPFAAAMPGSGPRHFTFHPNGRIAYLIEELSGTVSAFRYRNGKLTRLQSVSTHANNYSGAKGSADIHVSEDGKFLYASNRGDAHTIAVFAVARDGKLKWVEQIAAGGRSPRNFALAPGGNFLLVANQETNNVVVFKRDAATGKLTPTGNEFLIPKPVCLLFEPVNK